MVSTNLNISIALQNQWYQKKPNDIIDGHADQNEGGETRTITYTHANSSHFTQDFGGSPTGNKKSFMEAAWIKNYNGSSGGTDGYPGYYYVLKQKNDKTKPSWELQRVNSNNENYVGFVSGREE